MLFRLTLNLWLLINYEIIHRTSIQIVYNTQSFIQHGMEATEERNYIRLWRLIKLANQVLADVLRGRLHPSSLKSNESLLRGNSKFDSHLIQILYPQVGEYRGDFSELDITHLCTLLRCIGQIANSDDWKKYPDEADRSMIANINRIRNIRNKYSHTSNNAIKDSEFDKMWTTLSQCVPELANTTDYKKEIEYLFNCPIDPQFERKWKDLKGKTFVVKE